jgi:hypothetical protein
LLDPVILLLFLFAAQDLTIPLLLFLFFALVYERFLLVIFHFTALVLMNCSLLIISKLFLVSTLVFLAVFYDQLIVKELYSNNTSKSCNESGEETDKSDPLPNSYAFIQIKPLCSAPFDLSVNGTIAGINNGKEPEIVDLESTEAKSRLDIRSIIVFWFIIYGFNFHNIETK